jgi:hypothetical protein
VMSFVQPIPGAATSPASFRTDPAAQYTEARCGS